ncbi:transcriptional regulator, LysR family [Mucilaginibacter paludis DSM 18603]|uniref:Transcriptional regulator, LysR family n=2 Tax=Mucilaginibacter TaxID=423349 RepID=H1Y1S9_9SPHI|nr:transcriptional regulator, LysR family [Mucilaginibacter paludis DSM 18603]
MFDFRLKVFYTVAKRLNFTRAAAELFITQPAVTKHIRELEAHFKCSLFERSGNKKITLTAAGETLLVHAEQLFGVYREMEYDMNLLTQSHGGQLRIGASTTVAQYVIPPVLAKFHQKFKNVQVNLISGNTEDIEQALLRKEIELGIVEGMSHHPQIKYEEFLEDEIVLISNSQNKAIQKQTIKPEELKNYALLLREPGSGTLEVILHALKPHGVKLADLQIEMQLGSTESIKSYLINSNCLALISIHAIIPELKNNQFKVIDIKGLTISRSFSFIQTHGHPGALAELFIRFAKSIT